MPKCDLTGIDCEAREILKLPCNPPLWISPVVKILLLQGIPLPEINELYANSNNELGAMESEERKEFFKGSVVKIL